MACLRRDPSKANGSSSNRHVTGGAVTRVNATRSHQSAKYERAQGSKAGVKLKQGDEVGVDEVFINSRKFPLQFPVHTPRLENLLQVNPFKDELRREGKVMNRDMVSQYINSTYPLVHEKVLLLLSTFLSHKMEWGDEEERELYERLSIHQFIDKLLLNRPAVFINSWDQYLLVDGTPGFGGFELVGKDNNPKKELRLEHFNSYDEMKLAALISICGLSPFINRGDKNNCGVVGNDVTHELDGVVMGQVGARFEKEGFMDWQDCMVKENQNTEENGYGRSSKRPQSKILRAWANLWELEHFPSFREIKEAPQDYEYVNVKDAYLNKPVYKARIQILAEVMLIDASNRAKECKKKAYIHVSGLGLNEWMISPIQNTLYIEAWYDAIRIMPPAVTGNIAGIHFSGFPVSKVNGLKSGDKLPDTEITIKLTKREPFERVPKNCVLVCQYPSNSNAIAGNEFWMGSLSAAEGPAAACSSSIAELHNPHINTRVGAAHLRVATRKGDITHINDYVRSHSGKGAIGSTSLTLD